MWKQIWKLCPMIWQRGRGGGGQRRCSLLRAVSWLCEAQANRQEPFSPFHWILEGDSYARPPAEKWGQQCLLCNQQNVRIKDILAHRAAHPLGLAPLQLSCFLLFQGGTLLSGPHCIHHQTAEHHPVALDVFRYRHHHTDELCLSRNVKLSPQY